MEIKNVMCRCLVIERQIFEKRTVLKFLDDKNVRPQLLRMSALRSVQIVKLNQKDYRGKDLFIYF